MKLSNIGVRAMFVALAAWTALAGLASAEEPFDAFLEGLRRREMYDAAVMYIEQLRTRADLPAEIKSILSFEEGACLLEGAKLIKDTAERQKQLDAAAGKFREFLKATPSHPRAALANTQLGLVIVERAKSKVEESSRPNRTTQKPQLLEEARKLFAEATTALDTAEKQLEKNLEDFPKYIEPKKTKEIAARDEARGFLLRGKLYGAMVREQHAKAYDDKAPERKKLLEEAAKQYGVIAERWRRLVVGPTALMYQGRCLLEIGDAKNRKQALSMFDQILLADEQDPDMRALQALTMQAAMQALTHPEEKKVDEAIKRGKAFLEKGRGAELRTPEWLGVQLGLAQALKLKWAAEKAAPEKAKLAREIGTLAKVVAKIPSPHRDEAKKIVADPNFGGSQGPPADFAAAWEQALQEYQTSQTISEELKTATDPKKKEEIEKNLIAARRKVLDMTDLALRLKDVGDEPPSTDLVDKAMFLKAAIYFYLGENRRALVLGEYIARKKVQSADARNAATIVLNCYSQAFNESLGGSRDWEAQAMDSFAKYVLQTWPEGAMAENARVALVETSLFKKDYSQLTVLLEGVPETSPLRSQMELKVGNALWSQYVRGAKLEDGAEGKPTKAQLEGLQKQAQSLLESGVARAAKESSADNPSQNYMLGMLYLAQVYGRSSQFDKAVKLLEGKPTGLLTLLEAKNPTAMRIPGFRPEVYKVALQSYVTMKDQAKADKMMAALEDAFKDAGPAGQSQLTAVYVKLGLELQEDMNRLLADGKKAEYKETLVSAESFLKRIADKSDTNNFATTNWVAETFYGLGESATLDGDLSKAKELFAVAGTTYQAMLGKPGDWWPTKDAAKIGIFKTLISIKVAKCARATGDFKTALDQLQKIIAASAANIEAQKEWCHTYEAWGKADREPKHYFKAMTGEVDPRTPGRRLYWGWSYMAQVAVKYPNLIDTFFEARYKLADCYYQYALLGDGATKQSSLGKAEQAITFLARQYPEMGGEEWYGKYDALLKRIQAAMNKPIASQGLKAFFESQKSATAAAK